MRSTSRQAAPREEGALLQFLHPESVAGGVVELGKHVEPGEREPLSSEELAFGGAEHLGAREEHAAPGIVPARGGAGGVVVRLHASRVHHDFCIANYCSFNY